MMLRSLQTGLIVVAMGVLAGCEWDGDSSGANTSKGVSLNFSGVYHGDLDGGAIVASRSITRFTLTQAGSAVQVWDNNGSYYEGAVGSPGVVSSPSDAGVYPRGAELVQAQVSFKGTDGSTGREIQFVGVMHAVAVEDIQSTEIVSESTTESSSGSSSSTTDTQTEVSPLPGIVTTTSSSSTSTTSTNQSQTQTSGSSTVVGSRYSITGANTHYVLEGNWMEVGGATLYVKGSSSATFGVVEILDGGRPESGDSDFTLN